MGVTLELHIESLDHILLDIGTWVGSLGHILFDDGSKVKSGDSG